MLTKCKAYKRVCKTLMLNYLWNTVSMALTILPIVIVAITKFVPWWIVMPYMAVSWFGAVFMHCSFDVIKECHSELDAIEDTYNMSVMSGVKPEVFIAAMNHMEEYHDQYKQGKYHVTFHEDDTYSVIYDETDEVVYHGGINEDK